MKFEINIKQLEKAVNRSLKALDSTEKENNKLTRKFISDATENLHYIASTAIDKFYEDYEPHQYNRRFDLYNTYRIKVTEDKWQIDFDPSFMQGGHRVDAQDPEYIFENSFIHGWHGGAISGEGHPNPGTPYWRLPETMFDYDGFVWYAYTHSSAWTVALRSPSPYKEIVRKSNTYMKVETAKYYEKYNNNIDKFLRQMTWNLERIR